MSQQQTTSTGIITVTSSATRATLCINEEGGAYASITWADLAHQLVEAIQQAAAVAEEVEFDRRLYKSAEVLKKFKNLESFYRGGRFDWRKYYCAGSIWAMSLECDELFRSFKGWPDGKWLSMEFGRIGALRFDAAKARLESVSPASIAKDREESYKRCIDLSPITVTFSQVENLLEHGPHVHWRLDHISSSILEDLPATPVRIGKIVRVLWPNLTDAEVEHLADAFADHMRRNSKSLEVIVLDDVRDGYNRPQGSFVSCMKGKGCFYDDLLSSLKETPQIAVIMDGKTVTARAILWPAVNLPHGASIKLMDRIYYQSALEQGALQKWAKKHNYHYKTSQSTHCNRAVSPTDDEISLAGSFVELVDEAKMGAWEYAPYLDTFRSVDIGSDRLCIFSTYAEVELNQTDGGGGLLTSRPDCDWCGAQGEVDDLGFWLCGDCRQYADECPHCGQWFDSRSGVATDDDGIVCPQCWQDAGWTCTWCGSNFCASHLAEIESRDPDGLSGQLCPSCLEQVQDELDEDLPQCLTTNCHCLLTDSPSGYCLHHEQQIYFSCDNCKRLTPRENRTHLDLGGYPAQLCQDCSRQLQRQRYLAPLWLYVCAGCDSILRNTVQDPATVTGIDIWCPDCAHQMRTPDDWQGPIPARIHPRQSSPSPRPSQPSSNLAKVRLLEICRFWQAEHNRERLVRRLQDLANPRDNGSVLDALQLHAGAVAAERMFPEFVSLSHPATLDSWHLSFETEGESVILWYKIWTTPIYRHQALMCGVLD